VKIERFGRVAGALLGFLAVAGSMVGCQRDADAMRDMLRAREAAWRRDVEALGREQSEVRRLLDSAPSASNPDLVGARRRLAAQLDSNRQSLVDLEIGVSQVGPRVAVAAATGVDEGNRALEDESARMAASLALLREQMPSLRREIAGLATVAAPRAASEITMTATSAATANRSKGE